MIKSELVKRISAQNSAPFERDVEKVVNAIFVEMVEALRRGDRVDCGGSEPFQVSSEKHARGAILVLVLSSRSERKLCLTSRLERKCGRGLIAKRSRQTDSPPALTNKRGAWFTNGRTTMHHHSAKSAPRPNKM